MTEPVAEEPTDDTVADGTQLPTADELPDEEGDAGVNDDGTEEWYDGGED
jgi:hypothetical protein